MASTTLCRTPLTIPRDVAPLALRNGQALRKWFVGGLICQFVGLARGLAHCVCQWWSDIPLTFLDHGATASHIGARLLANGATLQRIQARDHSTIPTSVRLFSLL